MASSKQFISRATMVVGIDTYHRATEQFQNFWINSLNFLFRSGFVKYTPRKKLFATAPVEPTATADPVTL